MATSLGKCANWPFLDPIPKTTGQYQLVHSTQRKQCAASSVLPGVFGAQWGQAVTAFARRHDEMRQCEASTQQKSQLLTSVLGPRGCSAQRLSACRPVRHDCRGSVEGLSPAVQVHSWGLCSVNCKNLLVPT